MADTLKIFENDDFNFISLDEEILVDGRCREMLRQFYLSLQLKGMSAGEASEMAFSADLYLRDYLVDFCRCNIVRPEPGVVTRFAASWYITHTLDPEFELLEKHLQAIHELYKFMHSRSYISTYELTFLTDELGQCDYYRQRIDTFLNLSGDGFVSWDRECPARTVL